jgi:hypothetical protein
VDVDGPALLGERAAFTGGTRNGDVSVGGATRLVAAGDGWIAVSLARPADVELVPAWLEGVPVDPAHPWSAVAEGAARTSVAALVERAALLGIPAAALGEVAADPPPTVRIPRAASGGPRRRGPPVVVDLSALWAGPLCAQLLGDAGARVIKVESISRLDGGRAGSPAFFDLLNAGHESVTLDFRSAAGRAALRSLVRRADVVIEGSRPRALRQLGIDRDEADAQVWVSITAHGRDGAAGDRVGFGDDAAVAGGLVTHDSNGPCFCADAVADPLAGMVAAAAAMECLADGGHWFVDVALSSAAALASQDASGSITGDASGGSRGLPTTALEGRAVAAPRARASRGQACQPGHDTARVLRELAA